MTHDPQGDWRARLRDIHRVSPVAVRPYLYPIANGQRAVWHSHDQGQFFYTTQGVVRMLTPQGIWLLPPFKGVWIPPTLEHELIAHGDVHCHGLYYERDAIPSHWRHWEPGRVIAIDDGFHADLHALSRERQTLPPLQRHVDVIARLSDGIGNSPPVARLDLPLPGDRRLQAICASLIAQPEHDGSLDYWGNEVGASPRTLARLFVSETRLTFGQWRQQLRLLESLARLASGHTVADTAKAMGFKSRSAFTAMFKRRIQCAPQTFCAVD